MASAATLWLTALSCSCRLLHRLVRHTPVIPACLDTLEAEGYTSVTVSSIGGLLGAGFGQLLDIAAAV